MPVKKIYDVFNNILNYQIYLAYKLNSRNAEISRSDVKKLLSFYSFVKRNRSSRLREIFFNAFLSLLLGANSKRLQNKVSRTIPFLLKSLMPTGKLTRVHSIAWKIINALLHQNKSNMIIFRQNKGLHLIKKFLEMDQDNRTKRSRNTINCIKAVKRQLDQINDCIAPETILEARINLRKKEKLLSNQVILQSKKLENQKATALEKNVLSIFHKTFLSKLPKIFWTK